MVTIINKGRDTTSMRRPCATLEVDGKTIKNVTEIRLTERTVTHPFLVFQQGGGLGVDQIHTYREPDLREVYDALKQELEPHGVVFRNVLTD